MAFSAPKSVQADSGAHPASYSMATRVVSLEIKRPGREADRPPPFSAKIKNECSYIYFSLIYLHRANMDSVSSALQRCEWNSSPLGCDASSLGRRCSTFRRKCHLFKVFSLACLQSAWRHVTFSRRSLVGVS
jgi:hypothetical protein